MIHVETDFFPGALGAIAALHGAHYAAHWGFGTFFEAKVAQELAAFALRRTSKDLVLLARDADGVAASLILDLNDPESGSRGAHLRWFLAADRCRGSGIGRRFMARAMDHAAQQGDGSVWLTTFEGLAPARHLYESFGFTLITAAPGEAWGVRVTEQLFQHPPSQTG